MSGEHEALQRALGRVGAWTFTFDELLPDRIAADVRAVEAMGYSALWLPEGGGSNDILTSLGWALGASERLTVASGIANISAREPEVLARGAAFLGEANGGRLVLGIGVGHSYSTERRGVEWDRPLARMGRYLDVMDDATSPWRTAPRVLAALGDGMLRVAATRALGAHSYFVPVAHTAHARSVLGDEPVLAVELGVLPGVDDETARSCARAWAVHYLELPNYANNWRRMGFGDDDVAGHGSDRLLEAAFAWGSTRGDRRAGAGAPRRGCRPRLRPGDRRARRGCCDGLARPRGTRAGGRSSLILAVAVRSGSSPDDCQGNQMGHTARAGHASIGHMTSAPHDARVPEAAGTLEVGGTDTIYWEAAGRPAASRPSWSTADPGRAAPRGTAGSSIRSRTGSCCSINADAGGARRTPSEPQIDLSSTRRSTSSRTWSCSVPSSRSSGGCCSAGRGAARWRSPTPRRTRTGSARSSFGVSRPVAEPRPTGGSEAASRRCSPRMVSPSRGRPRRRTRRRHRGGVFADAARPGS